MIYIWNALQSTENNNEGELCQQVGTLLSIVKQMHTRLSLVFVNVYGCALPFLHACS